MHEEVEIFNLIPKHEFYKVWQDEKWQLPKQNDLKENPKEQNNENKESGKGVWNWFCDSDGEEIPVMVESSDDESSPGLDGESDSDDENPYYIKYEEYEEEEIKDFHDQVRIVIKEEQEKDQKIKIEEMWTCSKCNGTEKCDIWGVCVQC